MYVNPHAPGPNEDAERSRVLDQLFDAQDAVIDALPDNEDDDDDDRNANADTAAAAAEAPPPPEKPDQWRKKVTGEAADVFEKYLVEGCTVWGHVVIDTKVARVDRNPLSSSAICIF